jgi:thiamine-phosphate diphosphorylase
VGPVLCLVTDRARYGGDVHLLEAIGHAAVAGVELVQVREKDLEAGALYELVRRCVAAVAGTRTRILVNDRVDVALAAGAHGVHLPADSVPAVRLRALAPRGFLIGRSVHAAYDATRAAADRATDYLIAGTVFPSASKPAVEAAGVETLRSITRAVPLPVLAIGGITVERMGSIRQAGAAGCAAIGLFADAARHGPQRLQTVVKQARMAFDTPQGVS